MPPPVPADDQPSLRVVVGVTPLPPESVVAMLPISSVTHTQTQSHKNTQRGGSIHACMCVSMSLYCITYPRMCRARPQLKKLRGPPWSPPHPASAVVGTTLRSAGATPTCSRKQPRISTSDKRKNEQGQFLLSRIRSSWPRSGARDR